VPLNLIDTAMEEARKYRQTFESQDFGITEGLTPKAVHSVRYLRVRESINRGCREAVKLVPNKTMRSPTYSVLMQACYDIFHYGHPDQVKAVYNQQLVKLIGDY